MIHEASGHSQWESGQTQTVLCINSGSSSLKFHLYEMGPHTVTDRLSRSQPHAYEELLVLGAVEGVGREEGRVWFKMPSGQVLVDKSVCQIDRESAVDEALQVLSGSDLPSIEAIGHRVVHGGPDHFAPELVTPVLLDALKAHTAWAPLHIPSSLRVIEALRARLPGVPQVVCFDTAFHARMPEVARRLPLPRRFYSEGVHKYGFHGLSYEYLLGALGELSRGRLVMAHLGNGASMVACRDGQPLDTTMGMTPLGGLMMGTRTGDLDPGVILYLLREQALDAGSLERLLDKESGLKGVSGKTGDMQELLELRASGDAAASEAVEMFAYLARKAIGALAAVLGGLDRLVFSGGIGENAPSVRSLICAGLEYLGIELDPAKNEAGQQTISSDASACAVMVVPTNEELVIARHTFSLVFGRPFDEKEGESWTGRSQ